MKSPLPVFTIFILVAARNEVKTLTPSEAVASKIRPTDEPPGNNLDIGNTHLQADSQPASTIYSPENKNDKQESNSLLSPSGEDDKTESAKLQTQALVWDNCLETFFRDNQGTPGDQHFDMEHAIEDLKSQYKQNGSLWNKRDTLDPIKNITVQKWIEKYKNLTNAKTEQRIRLKNDLLNKLTTMSNTFETTTVIVMPITRKVFEEATRTPDVTSRPVTKNDTKVSYTEDWIEVKERTKIRFSGLPRTENYLIPSLKLEEGFYPFSFMSEFFSFIHPFDFPVGLIKDIVWGHVHFPHSFLQSIKVESTFLTFIIIFGCIALVIPSYLIILGILKLMSKSRCDEEIETGALFPDADDSDCNDRMLVFGTLFVVLICSLLISGMAVSNEQANAAVFDSHNIIRCACADLATWLASAARELYHSIVPPVDLVAHAFREDLKNIELLLGEPIQQAIASESGIELALDSLMDITIESEDLSSKITVLRDVSMKAGSLASITSDRIKDLGRQIENLKRTCNLKDLPLCDTIKTNSLEMHIKFDLILREQRLLELRTLGVENLTKAIKDAKQELKMLPSAINKQTTQLRKDILEDVETRQQSVHASSRILNDIARHLTAGLHTVARKLDAGLNEVQQYESWRWITMLASIISFLVILILIVISMLCGCGKAREHAKRTLQVSTIWLGLLSLLLWAAVSSIFLIAGHAEIYVCHALWDAPQYKTLSALLDRPSPIFEDNDSVFTIMLKEVENVTIDASIRDVLRDCEQNRPAYVVFQLDKVFDVNKETSHFEWQELQRDLAKFTSTIDVGILKTISVYFGKLLSEMTVVSDVNLAKYRTEYNNPVVGKDIPSLVDQLENVAAQTTDLSTAGRLETLATRAQRLYLTNIKPLEQLRADVVFKLTELELQIMPFRRKLNVSLSHINTAQYYIDNQGDLIAQKKITMFISRLISHAAAWRSHVLASTGEQAAKCRPLYNVYMAARSMLCTRYVSSLHGWWVCGFFLGIMWCTTLTPLCVKLWRLYARQIKAEDAIILANLGTGQQTPTTALCESGSHWNTPGPPPPPRSDSW